MIRILVLCTGNSCRSQMAEGYFRSLADSDIEVYSAGIETHGLNPYAVLIMAEDGIDISNHTSNNVNEYIDLNFDYIITVCDNAKERCPYFPAKAEIVLMNGRSNMFSEFILQPLIPFLHSLSCFRR
jgi:arsenate reductase